MPRLLYRHQHRYVQTCCASNDNLLTTLMPKDLHPRLPILLEHPVLVMRSFADDSQVLTSKPSPTYLHSSLIQSAKLMVSSDQSITTAKGGGMNGGP